MRDEYGHPLHLDEVILEGRQKGYYCYLEFYNADICLLPNYKLNGCAPWTLDKCHSHRVKMLGGKCPHFKCK